MEERIEVKKIVNFIIEQFDDTSIYYDRKINDLISIDDYYMSLAIENNNEALPYNWQRNTIEICLDIINDNMNRFILLPKKNILSEHKLMEEFIEKVLIKEEKEEIEFIITGANRLKRFKAAIEGNNYEVLWNLYIYEEYHKVAIDWCEKSHIRYNE